MSATSPIAAAAHVVVVGAGQAGFQTALSLRDYAHAGPVTVVGDEPGLPYNRPPLSKSYLTDDSGPASVLLRDRTFYATRDIEVRAGVAVTRIDRQRGQVVLAGDERIDFDHLVLATGSRARPIAVPGAGLGGVVTLRTLADATRLRTWIGGPVGGVVVIGGGFIGLELAAAAATAGHHVTVVEAGERPMARAVAPELADHIAAEHRRRGIRLEVSTAVRSIVGRGGHAVGVELEGGEVIRADLVVVGVGAAANSELAGDADLELCPVTRGVLVDERLLTADPAISAIGDCATYPSRFADHPVRLESVQNAVDHARHVAERLATGSSRPYDKVPWFWTTQYDLKIQTVGIGRPDDDRRVVGDPASGAFSVLRFAADRLVAVESVNRPADHMAARGILAGDRRPRPADAQSPGFTLKSFLSFAA